MSHQELLDLPLRRIPFAVLDLETTGLTPGFDRIVELSVVELLPGAEPKVRLDTLINPGREMGATEIHGITEEDVRDAPTFTDLRGALAALLAGRIVAAHNADFEMRFLRSELGPSFGPNPLPYVCTMELHHFLYPGARRSLVESCSTFHVEQENAHCARCDAEATARLLRRQIKVAGTKDVTSLRDLAGVECGRFPKSLRNRPLTSPPGMMGSAPTKPRDGCSARRARSPQALYLEELVAILADLVVDDEELRCVRALRVKLGLAESAVRSLHARIYMSMLSRYTEEGILDDSERANLRRLHEALRTLGWAPGD